MSYEKVMYCLMQSAKTVIEQGAPAGLGDIPVRWPNMELVPPDDDPYVVVDVIPGNMVIATLGQLGEDEYDGVLQFGLYFPMLQGYGGIIGAYEALRRYFVAGSSSAYDGVEVRFYRNTLSPIFKDTPARIAAFVRIEWECRINRQFQIGD